VVEEEVEWRGGLFGREEDVVCGVRRAKFLVGMACIATGGRRFAALCVEALDGSGARENARAFAAHDVH